MTVATKPRAALVPAQAQTFPRPAGVAELHAAPWHRVVRGRWQYRRTFDQEQLVELARSLLSDGLINRPIVFVNEQGDFELIAGERRWRAWCLLAEGELSGSGLDYAPADYDAIPLRVVEGDARQLQIMTLVDNLQRDNPDAVDEGLAFERLVKDLSVSEAELARLTGKNRAYIQQRRALAGAAPEVQQALIDGTITFSVARAIATGAPGELKLQAKALQVLVERVKRGNRVTEKDAGEVVDAHVFGAVPKKLQALGWGAEKGYDGLLVWSSHDRPRLWGSREALEAVKEKRHPTPRPLIETLAGAEPPKLSDEARAQLETRYTVSSFHGWYCVQEGYAGKKQYMDATEAADVAHAWATERAGMQDRYRAGGWTLEERGKGYWTALGPKGGSLYLSDWERVGVLAEEIEAGRAVEPSSSRGGGQATQYTCESCKKKTNDVTWRAGSYYCKPCLKTIVDEEKRQKEALQQAIAQRFGDWIAEIPVEAMRLWATTLGGGEGQINNYDAPAQKRAKVLKLDEPALRRSMLSALFTLAWEHREALGDLGLAELLPGSSPAKGKVREKAA